eukprot:2340447-Amphidinium_carterae.1
MRANKGYHHDFSSSLGYLYLTDDEDFNEHPESAFMLTFKDKRKVEAVVKMRFNKDFPPMDGRMVTPLPEAQSDGDQDEDGHDDPNAEEKAETIGRPASRLHLTLRL